MVNVPNDVDIIANMIRPPICTRGIRDEKIRAPNPMLEKTSNKIVIKSPILLDLFCDFKKSKGFNSPPTKQINPFS